MSSRVLVIGLDGATLNLVEPWAAAGYLPTFARLMGEGCYGTLNSVLPVLSASAWASFMTGVNPGKHGLFDFLRREEGSYRLRPVNRQHMAAPSLWRRLSDAGLRCAVMNVPMTYPAEEINGLMVTGLGTPAFKPFTYPPELGPELLAQGYRQEKEVFYRPGQEEAFLSEVYAVERSQTEAAKRWLTAEAWDFFMLVYRHPDEMAHFFWKFMDESHPAYDAAGAALYRHAIRDYTQRVDGWLAELWQAAGPECQLLVVSDHGTGPLYKDVLLNEWLRQKGYLVLDEVGQVAAARLGLTRSNISRALRGVGLRRLETWLKDQLGDRIEVLPQSGRAQFPQAIDWSRTKAYSFGYHGQIYLNLRRREPQGIVAPGEESETLTADLTSELEAMRDPADGRPVVSAVVAGREAFHGPQMRYAPDLVVMMRDLAYITRQGYEFGAQPGAFLAAPQTFESGSHRLEGIYFACGPAITDKGRSETAGLMDIAPTVLHLLGQPVPSYMDGQVLGQLFRPGWVEAQVIRTVEERLEGQESRQVWASAAEEAEITTRLKQLGYLE